MGLAKRFYGKENSLSTHERHFFGLPPIQAKPVEKTVKPKKQAENLDPKQMTLNQILDKLV